MTNPYSEPEDDDSIYEKVDMVNHPPHYTNHPVFSEECIFYTSRMMFGQGNAFKYLWRAGKKGPEFEDMRKYIFYATDPRCKESIALDKETIAAMKEELRRYAYANPEDTLTITRASLLIDIASGVM